MAAVAAVGLAPSIKKKLIANGFRSLRDVRGIGPTELARATGITAQQALSVLRSVDSTHEVSRSHGVSAADLLKDKRAEVPVVSFCEALDSLLGGGVQCGEITEFCGTPGVGKTQIAMQLAVDAAIPVAYGGNEAGSVYIDTEGSFHAQRIANIAAATVAHIQALAKARGEACDFSAEQILGGIHVFRCCTEAELLATIRLLQQFIQANPVIKLVVVDSIAFHFRHDVKDMAARTRTLAVVANDLHEVAYKGKIAVAITNHVTTRISDGVARLLPALGESWSHACTNRLLLTARGMTRSAKLLKSTSRMAGEAEYQVTKDGVRDAPRGTPHEERKDDGGPRKLRRVGDVDHSTREAT